MQSKPTARGAHTAQKTGTEICTGASDRPNRNRRSNSTLLKQSKYSANLLSVENITDLVTKYCACGIMKVTVKEKVMLSFDLTANANSIRILLFSMDCGQSEAYNVRVSNGD